MSSAADVIGTLSVNSETSRLPVKLNFTTNNSKSFHGSKMMLICLTLGFSFASTKLLYGKSLFSRRFKSATFNVDVVTA